MQRENSSRPLLLVAAPLLTPLLVTAVWLRRHHFGPLFDVAMTEARVRDVGTVHTPLLGLPGRLGDDKPGSHPGPLSFYLLAPLYRVMGGTYWALRFSQLALNGAVIVASLVVAERRGGARAVFGIGVILGLLEMGFGLVVLSEPWNPQLPVLWFFLFALCVWSVVAGDVALLPALVVSGTFCAQTHIPYLPICAGLALVALASVGVSSWRRQEIEGARRTKRAVGIAALSALVLWAPVLLEQATRKPGNISVLVRYFGSHRSQSVGFKDAARIILTHLDAWHSVVHTFEVPGALFDWMRLGYASPVRGAIVFFAWIGSLVLSRRLQSRALDAIHVVIVATLILELVSFSRIVGVAWHYLVFSAWTFGGLLLFGTAATYGSWIWRRWIGPSPRSIIILAGAAFLTILAIALRTSLDVEHAGAGTPNPSAQLGALLPKVIMQLGAREMRTGKPGRYLVISRDALYGGAQGLGLAIELESSGFFVGVPKEFGLLMVPHRVMDPKGASATVQLVTGGWIDELRKDAHWAEIAYDDERTREERDEYDRNREKVLLTLRRLGKSDAAERFDRDHGAVKVPGIDLVTGLAAIRTAQLGIPAAVFIGPTEKQ